MKILVYGYGNPGREDDGLGIKFAESVEEWTLDNPSLELEVDMNYQLNIEDALTISGYDVVFFIDASMEDIGDYQITRIQPSEKVNFSMHAVSPSYITYLCQTIYDKHPLLYLVHIKGYHWELKEGISAKAESNLDEALNYLKDLLQRSAKPKDIMDLVAEYQS